MGLTVSRAIQRKQSRPPPRSTSLFPPGTIQVNHASPLAYRGFGLVEISPEFIVEEDTPCTRRADVLVQMAETWLHSGPRAVEGAEKYQVIVHIDAQTLTTGSPGRCEIEDGDWLALDTARRLGCDASLLAMTEDSAGNILNIGRKSRAIPAPIARALATRDQGCRFPGRTRRRFVDGHHIEHWAAGGETKLDNLVQLCRTHHRLIHEGGFVVEKTPSSRLLSKRPDGKVIESTGDFSTSNPNSIESLKNHHQSQGLGISANTGTCQWDGVPMDYHMAVDGLLAIKDRARPALTSRA